ncbi:hypothetical protein M9458_043824, partial [Cirrhinus mrigala]
MSLLFPSNEPKFPYDPPPQSANPMITLSPQGTVAEPQASSRGRHSTLPATRSPRHRGQPLPPPARPPTVSPASSNCSAVPTIPPIEKWTVLSLRQALISCDAQFSKRFNKAEL